MDEPAAFSVSVTHFAGSGHLFTRRACPRPLEVLIHNVCPTIGPLHLFLLSWPARRLLERGSLAACSSHWNPLDRSLPPRWVRVPDFRQVALNSRLGKTTVVSVN